MLKRKPMPRGSYILQERENIWKLKLLTRIDAAGRRHYYTIRILGSRIDARLVACWYATAAREAALQRTRRDKGTSAVSRVHLDKLKDPLPIASS